MKKFSTTFLLLFGGWMLLTLSFNVIEVAVGLIVSVIISWLCKEFIFYENPFHMFNPKVWVNSLIYIALIFCEEIKSHIAVAGMILTGRTNPAIVKVPTKLRSDSAKTLVANSITLTPGTLTIDMDDALYVHCLSYKESGSEFELFEKYARRIEG